MRKVLFAGLLAAFSLCVVPALAQQGGISGGASGNTPCGTSGQIQYNNSGACGGFTLSGDGSLNTGTGALTVSSIGGKAVSLGAAFTTTGAGAPTLAFPASSFTYTFPSANSSLAPLVSPSFTTPNIGVALGASLALGGATLPTNGVFAADYSPGANTTTPGLSIINANAATSGNQQDSCAFIVGAYYNTTTPASNPVGWNICTVGVQGNSVSFNSQLQFQFYTAGSLLETPGIATINNFSWTQFTGGAFLVNSLGSIQFATSGSFTTQLYADGNDILALRTTTSPNTSRIYSSYTDTNNGSWAGFNAAQTGTTEGGASGTFAFGTYGNGTGISTLSKLRIDVLGVDVGDYNLGHAGAWGLNANTYVAGNVLTLGGSFFVNNSGNTQVLTEVLATGFQTNSLGLMGFSASSTSPTSPDSAFSRISAGHIGVGTGAQGSVAGVIDTSGYYAAGVKGVTCSGALTVIASVTISDGIITAATGTGGTCS